eukprot:TRINITY_DN13251_c0_g1_i4.p1 TRINITY_DN13251_c0_g1~~TRINITY_DN13251_c0_g1_i4.p1  ORF type:complete len:124 (-),score=3.64 TRINITY_DN13251_c0_g1_i4:2622-2993(-)
MSFNINFSQASSNKSSRKKAYKICDDARHIRKISPCDQVKGLQICPNRLLFIPQRDARTAARISIYMAKLVCCVFGPVKSIEGPAIAPANKDLHLAVLHQNKKHLLKRFNNQQEKLYINNKCG